MVDPVTNDVCQYISEPCYGEDVSTDSEDDCQHRITILSEPVRYMMDVPRSADTQHE